jgi:hypothetical protein
MLIRWLARHRVITFFLALGYIAYIVLAHDLMQRPAHWANGELGDRTWNILVVGAALPFLVAACVWLIARLRRHPRAGVAWTYLIVTMVLATTSFFTLLQVNIEIIHFPQYAIVAILLFALTGSFLDTMILGTAAGIVDEGYQYFCLHSHWRTYFDFNDVILNTVGVGMALTAVFILQREPMRRTAGRKVVIAALILVGLGLTLGAAGTIRTTQSPDPNGRVVALRRCPVATKFWHTTNWGKTYHIVEPEWGLAATAVLVLLYGALGAFQPRSLLRPTLQPIEGA